LQFCHFFSSTPSPHRTPPPPQQQRQGVIIQRHNANSSKPPSPAPPRHPPQGQFSHHYAHGEIIYRKCKQAINKTGFLGHDALSHLVDVAVAQQALPVPNDNHRRPPSHIAVSQADQSQSLPPPRDRFPYLHPTEVILHQQQVNFNFVIISNIAFILL
jgi:hypothetical protein